MPTSLRRSREPIFNLPIVVTVLLLVMAAIHGIRMILPEETDDLILELFAFAPERYMAASADVAQWPGGIAADLWTPFTYALLHNDLFHLVSNGTVFAAIGNVLARRMSAAKFLVFCAIMAPISALGELAIAAYQSAPVIGASGVICAMMGALARFAFPASVALEEEGSVEEAEDPLREADERPISARRSARDGVADDPVSRRALRFGPPLVAPILVTLRRPKVIRFILGFAVLNIVLVFGAPVLMGGGAAVAWMVHVAGFVAGFLLFPWFDGVRPATENEW
jgi:membrane associated rhomboid family serine protease